MGGPVNHSSRSKSAQHNVTLETDVFAARYGYALVVVRAAVALDWTGLRVGEHTSSAVVAAERDHP